MAYWGNDPSWQALSPSQKAAAMALMEAQGGDTAGAKNALGAMINRAAKDKQGLGESVSSKIYQPTIEPSQFARLPRILKDPQFNELVGLADSRLAGNTPDWVGGATHFLAKPETMLALEAKEPNKYKSWRSWTGYDPKTGQYANTIMSDASHVFLAPEGKHGDALPPPSASAPSTKSSEPAQAKDDPNMLNFLAALGGSGSILSGLGKGLGMEGLAGAGGQSNIFGSLASMFGGGGGEGGAAGAMGGGGGGDGGQGALANQAMTAASAPMDGQQSGLQKKPIDLAMLSQILAKRAQLGAGQSKGLGA